MQHVTQPFEVCIGILRNYISMHFFKIPRVDFLYTSNCLPSKLSNQSNYHRCTCRLPLRYKHFKYQKSVTQIVYVLPKQIRHLTNVTPKII